MVAPHASTSRSSSSRATAAVRVSFHEFRDGEQISLRIAAMSNKPPKELLDLLRKYDRGVQELTFALRELVLEELAPCFENIIEVYMISLVYASSERVMKDGICYIGVLKDRVNLGFNHGAHLRDPYGLLEGTGK